VGVDAHPVADLAAEESPDRLPQRLAEDVPQGVLDPADRGHADDPEPVVAVLGHDPQGLLDVPGVPADDHRGEVLDGADDGPRLPVQARLAPPDEAVLVGADLHEDPVPQLRVDDERLHGRDADGAEVDRRRGQHRALSFVGLARTLGSHSDQVQFSVEIS
jgi:hypothetical protein